MRHTDWAAVEDATVGDEVVLYACDAGYGRKNERLIKGVITKVTPATRSFTTEGVLRKGRIEFRANMRSPRQEDGLGLDGETRFCFAIASQNQIERLNDPHRKLRETAQETLRNIRWSVSKIQGADKKIINKIIRDIEIALYAAKALRDAL